MEVEVLRFYLWRTVRATDVCPSPLTPPSLVVLMFPHYIYCIIPTLPLVSFVTNPRSRRVKPFLRLLIKFPPQSQSYQVLIPSDQRDGRDRAGPFPLCVYRFSSFPHRGSLSLIPRCFPFSLPLSPYSSPPTVSIPAILPPTPFHCPPSSYQLPLPLPRTRSISCFLPRGTPMFYVQAVLHFTNSSSLNIPKVQANIDSTLFCA